LVEDVLAMVDATRTEHGAFFLRRARPAAMIVDTSALRAMD
jgi:hypothetical protein